MKKKKLDPNKVPAHVAIIMDGNRRWAAKRGLGPIEGHRVAAEEAIEPVVERAADLGVKYLTFWAFSTENWKRDRKEIQGLMKVFRDVIAKKLSRLHQKGVKLNFLGDLSKFPQDVTKRVLNGVKKTRANHRITVTFALNYGGRPEILRAVKKLVKDKVPPRKITETTFTKYLDTNGMPDPDLVIRTGGNLRLSGFLPWQSIYAELYFTPVLWPAFTPLEFEKAIASFQGRKRRFGGGQFKDYQK